MKKIQPELFEPFGTVLGISEGGVEVYSSDYSTVDPKLMPERSSFRSYQGQTFLGYKWQCVELARRWLVVNRNITFADIPMAYDIFDLREVKTVVGGESLPYHSFPNGSQRRPEVGSLLIWDEGGEFEITGHVAVITQVHDDRVCFIEQNVDNQKWPKDQSYSRSLKVVFTEDSGYWIEPFYHDAAILGWMIQTNDGTGSVKSQKPNPHLLDIKVHEVKPDESKVKEPWVDTSTPAGKAYVESMGHALVKEKSHQFSYLCLSEAAHRELRRATNELHYLFLEATNHVLQNQELLEKFNLPDVLWPKIKQSWNNRRNELITGRFDFTVSSAGIKVYEYNADSASCYLECSRIQDQWANHFGCEEGKDPGRMLFSRLEWAWKNAEISDVLHIMQDHDKEEDYHAGFMHEIISKAGISAKLIKGTSGLKFKNGVVVDNEDIPIKYVWKTWAWESALDQIRDQIINTKHLDTAKSSGKNPRIVDVFLHPEVVVYEPLWTLITSNKALLPVLWELFPNHPNLLNSRFDVDETLKRTGYVAKPIVGRQGQNISIVGPNQQLLKETDGAFQDRDKVYQELKALPQLLGKNAQISTFTADGSYAGACARLDSSLIIKGESDVYPLRFIRDEDLLANTFAD